MAKKTYKAEEFVAKLRQVDVLHSQAQPSLRLLILISESR